MMDPYFADLEYVLRLSAAFAEQLKTRTLEPVNVKRLPTMNGGQTSDFEIAAAAFFKRYAAHMQTVNLVEREVHRQQAGAWVQVCNVLDELNPPGWQGLGSGGDCAERAIRGLAALHGAVQAKLLDWRSFSGEDKPYWTIKQELADELDSATLTKDAP